jgi:CPA2 family monovalent cation:H+ antiporter-2
MLFDAAVVFDAPVRVVLFLVAFVFCKGVLATLAAVAIRFPARVAWLAGVGLAQFGEFGFVLMKLGEASGLADRKDTRALLAAGIISMFLTPLLVRGAPHFRAGERLLAPLERLIGVRGIDEAEAEAVAASGHVIIVGYGVAGRLTAAALDACGVPHLALELNAETVRKAKARGERVYYGDATSEEALGHARLAQARALVLVMSDPQAARRIVDAARRVAPAVPIFVRTRYLAESDVLREAGVRTVVAEELEAGVELIERLLRALGLDDEAVAEQTRRAFENAERVTRPAARA